ncbi:hypothetical protein [Bacillus cereus]|nr:hypothetical protein [Bacillus cereus]EJV74190.1 hypothetical protein IGE_05677 [Bacillus cereus HuB1-1]
MNKPSSTSEEFGILLREIIEKAEHGDEQAINQLNTVKGWLNDD